MKPKNLLILTILCMALLLSGAAKTPLARLTVVNKSGLPVEFRLTGELEDNQYYLRVPKGDQTVPTISTFTIIRDTYSIQVYYIELWDPVYGYSCSTASGSKLEMWHSVRVVVGECNQTLPNQGEPAMVKINGARTRMGGGRGPR